MCLRGFIVNLCVHKIRKNKIISSINNKRQSMFWGYNRASGPKWPKFKSHLYLVSYIIWANFYILWTICKSAKYGDKIIPEKINNWKYNGIHYRDRYMVICIQVFYIIIIIIHLIINYIFFKDLSLWGFFLLRLTLWITPKQGAKVICKKET